MKANSICTIHSLSMNILLAKARDTHRDHLCSYSSGVLWVQILPFKLLVLPISCGMEARKECRAQHRVCCVREMEGAGETGILTMGNNTDHIDSRRKQEENSHSWHRKWKENELREEIPCHEHLSRTHWKWKEGTCTSGKETKKSKPQLSEPWNND